MAKKKGAGIGCLIWIVAFCVVFILFFANLDKIKETFKETNIFDAIGSGENRDEDKPPVEVSPPIESPSSADDNPGSSEETPGTASGETSDTPDDDVTTVDPEKTPEPGTSEEPEKTPTAAAVKTRQATLFFVRVEDDGTIVRVETKRAISASDSPLTDAINALLAGPSLDEISRGLISLIPSGTKLLSAQVRGTTAYLNFNEAFMFNKTGIEGYAAQLKQIVWTATAFSTVLDVQILIEGSKVDYLGGEGVYIGRPLSRNSF